jgi:hypothetical protein
VDGTLTLRQQRVVAHVHERPQQQLLPGSQAESMHGTAARLEACPALHPALTSQPSSASRNPQSRDGLVER